jgi:NADPH:quinone reductase-like Zn-dependent oxidoreductase
MRDATVLGIASPANHDWLAALGVTPVSYGDGLAERLRAVAPNGIDAFIDLFGPQYVQLAVDLGIGKDRIETIVSRQKAQELGTKDLGIGKDRIETIVSRQKAQELGTTAEGSGDASTTDVLAQMADLVASGQIEIPIAATFPLEQVREAFAELEKRHTHGKIVLIP